MREKLLRLDEAFNKFIASTSKATVDTKTMLQNWQVGYQTAINSLIVAYTSVTEQLLTTESCQSAVVRTCTGITRNCIASVKEASERVISAQPVPASYAEKVKLAPKVHIPRGPTVQVPKTTTFIVAPTPEANVDFATSLMTKDALMKAVRPAEVGMKVDRITRAGGNEVRIEASAVDLERLGSLESFKKAGLRIKEDSKFNPRLLVFGVPKDMDKETIRENFIRLNLNGVDDPDAKIIYVFPPFANGSTTKCVLEVPPTIRNKLFEGARIYLGYSSCSFKDHVRIKHCYRCLSFGHLANENKCSSTSDVHCGHCSGNHEMKNCPNREREACCFNCKTGKLSDTAHTAFDGKKCPILGKRLKDRIHMINYG